MEEKNNKSLFYWQINQATFLIVADFEILLEKVKNNPDFPFPFGGNKYILCGFGKLIKYAYADSKECKKINYDSEYFTERLCNTFQNCKRNSNVHTQKYKSMFY